MGSCKLVVFSAAQNKRVRIVTPRFKKQDVQTKARTCDDAVLEIENLRLVVAGNGWVRIRHARQEGQVLGNVRLVHLAQSQLKELIL